MGRPPKPFYWEARGEWYVTINGKRHRLGPDEADAKTKFYELMAHPERPIKSDAVIVILDNFLTWTEENRSLKTFLGYKDFIQSFADADNGLVIGHLTPGHVTRWLQTKKTWNNTTKRNAITCLQRAFNWAEKNLGITNPIRGMEKPTANRRTGVISTSEFRTMLRNIPDKNFREMLLFCWDVGCRPQEAKLLSDRHVDLKNRICVLSASESKGGKRPRIIYLSTDRSVRIVQRRIGGERVFLNSQGRPWTSSAVRLAFERLEERIGKRYTQYMLRHTWITRKLQAGIDSHIVATLAGHSDRKMLDEVYSHVSDNHEFMLAQASKN